MSHPFPAERATSRLDHLYGKLRRPLATWFVVWLVMMGVGVPIFTLDCKLQTETTPRGIVDLEMPWCAERHDEILGAWDQDQRDAARLQTQIDYVFLLLYPVVLSLACWLLAGTYYRGIWFRAGRWIAFAVLFAAPLDALENVFLLQSLAGDVPDFVPVVTSTLASLKFGLVFLALGYFAAGGIRRLFPGAVPRMAMNQITLPSTRIDESVPFYEALGLKLIVDSAPRYVRFEAPDGATLSLHQVESIPDETGVTVYFEIPNLDQFVEELRQAGLDVDDPVDQRWLWRETRIADPDGNVVCLYWAGKNRRFPAWRVVSKA